VRACGAAWAGELFIAQPHAPAAARRRYACTIHGGRETRPLDAIGLGVACAALGAGEILLNCIDKDGTNSGFDLGLVQAMKRAVSIPVIASSGAGAAQVCAQSVAPSAGNRVSCCRRRHCLHLSWAL
jgi:imidazole glycerol phosphate synthase subunit HisF